MTELNKTAAQSTYHGRGLRQQRRHVGDTVGSDQTVQFGRQRGVLPRGAAGGCGCVCVCEMMSCRAFTFTFARACVRTYCQQASRSANKTDTRRRASERHQPSSGGESMYQPLDLHSLSAIDLRAHARTTSRTPLARMHARPHAHSLTRQLKHERTFHSVDSLTLAVLRGDSSKSSSSLSGLLRYLQSMHACVYVCVLSLIHI